MNKVALALIVAAFAATGCATKDYVHEYVDGQVVPVSKRVDGVEGRLAVSEGRLAANESRLVAGENASREGLQALGRRADATDAALKDHAALIDGASRTAHEALDRAKAAGKLAEGKFMYEVTMSDDTVKFSLEGAELSAATKQLLDAFADKLKSENRNVYVEIQGHTDTTGSEAYNLKLAGERAEMVKRYLNMKGGIPLHRMATIAYGETAPVADNKTRAGRESNRRVVLVVLN